MSWQLPIMSLSLATLCACSAPRSAPPPTRSIPAAAFVPDKGPRVVVDLRTASGKIVAAALREASIGAQYTPGYFPIAYPRGDLPQNQGVCTDVVIRALRGAGYDLQVLIHRVMETHFLDYPRREKRPDANIDHRRVPNQKYFFGRFGRSLSTKLDKGTVSDWKPGDIVYWTLDNGLDHAGIVSNGFGAEGFPLVVHNLARCAEEDVLRSWKIVGHFRFPK